MRTLTLTAALLLATSAALAGAYDVGPFDNDDAADWIADFGASPRADALSRALAVAPTRLIEAPNCSIAVAAAEVIAASRGKPHSKLPPEIAKWARAASTKLAPIVASAVEAVRLCRDSPQSELRELWVEGELLPAWTASLSDLEKRLR